MIETSISTAVSDLIVAASAETIIKNAGGVVEPGHVTMCNITDLQYPATQGNTTGKTVYHFQTGTVYVWEENGKTYITDNLS